MDPATGVLAASLASSWLYLLNAHRPPSVWRMTTKTLSTTLLAVLSWVRDGPTLLTAALLLGSIGDACLAWDGDAAFLSGLGSFLTAHTLYIALFARLGAGTLVGWRTVAAGLLVLVFAPTMLYRLLPAVDRDMRLPVLVYTAAIIVMDLAALTLDNGVVIAGTLSFTLSDAILATEKFLVSQRWMAFAVWVLYYGGQMMIACGL